MDDTILAKEKVLEFIREYFNQVVPFNMLVGLNVVKLTPAVVEVYTAMRSDLIGNTVQKILHGGVVATLLDVAGGLVAMAQSIEKLDALTTENVENRLKMWAPLIFGWIICCRARERNLPLTPMSSVTAVKLRSPEWSWKMKKATSWPWARAPIL
ncbi:MAG: hypothetical protein R2861_15470 [Desulfobacterales bacterium]